MKGIQRNFTGSKISMFSTSSVYFGQLKTKTKMAALPYDWLRNFQLLCNCWTEFNKTSQEERSKHPMPSLYFRADRKTKITALASDWLHYFRPFLCNRWMEFNETWQQESTHHTQVGAFWAKHYQHARPSQHILGWVLGPLELGILFDILG